MVYVLCTYFANTQVGLELCGVGRDVRLGPMWSLRVKLRPREKSVEIKRNSALVHLIGATRSNLP